MGHCISDDGVYDDDDDKLLMDGVMKALIVLRDVLRTLSSANHNTALRVTSRMWVAKFDVDEGNRTLAEKYVQIYKVAD